MKAALLTFLFFWGVPSWACPALEGQYDCYVGEYVLPVKVTSYEADGVKNIYFGSVNHIIDGEWHEYQEYVWPDVVITQRKSECIGQEFLKSEENSAVYRDGVKIQQSFRKFEGSLKAGVDLVVRSVSSLDGGKTVKRSEYGCARGI